jgi:hypothetical protein
VVRRGGILSGIPGERIWSYGICMDRSSICQSRLAGPETCFFITSLVDVDGLLHDECRMVFMIDYVFSVC